MPQNYFSFGNLKISSNTAIFNMQPAFKCSSAKLGLCKLSEVCYAKKAERQYLNVRKFRDSQESFWKKVTPEKFVSALINESKERKQKIKYLRFNEAGDFRNQKCVDKASKIAELLKEYNIRAYIYTSRIDLDYSSRSDNLIVTGSGFMIDNMYYVVNKHEQNRKVIAVPDMKFKSFSWIVNEKKNKCVKNCRICNKCKVSNKNVILQTIH